MNALHSALLTLDERGRVQVRWAEGRPRRADTLQVAALLLLSSGSCSISELNNRQLTEADLKTVGTHLYDGLQPPILSPGDVVEVRTDVPWLRALPWHLLRGQPGPLEARDIGLRVLPAHGPAQAPLGLRVRADVVDLRSQESEVDSDDLWTDTLRPLIGDSLEVRVHGGAPPQSLPVLDILHLLVEPATQRGALALLPARVWPELSTLLEAQPPKILLVECADRPSGPLIELCASLAAIVPSVALACAPRQPEGPDLCLATGAQLVALMLEQALPLADAARALGKREGRTAARAIWTWGGAAQPHPARNSQHGPWFYDEGWRLSLDRVTQTDMAMGATRAAQLARSDQEGSAECGVLLFWYGPRHSGLARFRSRMQWQLEQEERPGWGCSLVELSWPEVPSAKSWAASVASALALDGSLTGHRWKAALDTGISKFVEADLQTRGRASLAGRVVLFHHGVLRADPFEPERLNADLLLDYARWWAKTVVPAVPQSLVPALAITLEADPSDPLPKALERGLSEMASELASLQQRLMPPLPDIEPSHIVAHIARYKLMEGAEVKDRKSVANEIVARTGGCYEQSIQLVEQIPWIWPALLQSNRKRNTP